MATSGQQRADLKYAQQRADLRKRGQKRASRQKTKDIMFDFEDVAFQKSEEAAEKMKGSKWGWLVPLAIAIATGGASLPMQALAQAAYAGASTHMRNKKAQDVLDTAFTGGEADSLESKYGKLNMLDALVGHFDEIKGNIQESAMGNPWKAALSSGLTTFLGGAAAKGTSGLGSVGGGTVGKTTPSGLPIQGQGGPTSASKNLFAPKTGYKTQFGADMGKFLEGIVTDFSAEQKPFAGMFEPIDPSKGPVKIAGQEVAPFQGLDLKMGNFGHWNIGDALQAIVNQGKRRDRIEASNPYDMRGWKSKYHTRY